MCKLVGIQTKSTKIDRARDTTASFCGLDDDRQAARKAENDNRIHHFTIKRTWHGASGSPIGSAVSKLVWNNFMLMMWSSVGAAIIEIYTFFD